MAALNKFTTGERKIMIATDVAGRGLDIKGDKLVEIFFYIFIFFFSISTFEIFRFFFFLFLNWILGVDMVINFDLPTHAKDYIHRVGRTARGEKSGRAITFVTQ